MRDWSELEKLFTSLDSGGRGERLDTQWGQAGEHWMLAAVPSPLWRQRFRAAARMAGLRVCRSDLSDMPAEVSNEPDAEIRWYRVLKAFSANYSPEIPGQALGEDDEPLGYIYPGTVRDVAAASPAVCLHLESMESRAFVRAEPQPLEPTNEIRTPVVASSFWPDIHPEVASVARSRYEAGHFADAVESALKHLVAQLKTRLGDRLEEDLDGSALMKRVFSVDRPLLVLGDRAPQTGKSLQIGYMELFSGAMTGVRNPKAHGIVSIDDRQMPPLPLLDQSAHAEDRRGPDLPVSGSAGADGWPGFAHQSTRRRTGSCCAPVDLASQLGSCPIIASVAGSFSKLLSRGWEGTESGLALWFGEWLNLKDVDVLAFSLLGDGMICP